MSLYKRVMHFKKWSVFWPTLYLGTTVFRSPQNFEPSRGIRRFVAEIVQFLEILFKTSVFIWQLIIGNSLEWQQIRSSL